mmetsp:Transcript_2825/g.17586  ORF Transcript_2825/g.17586 Transcript_2825/m.17586 type:complete len:243 (+) Transcript_2825:334-1062(+)
MGIHQKFNLAHIPCLGEALSCIACHRRSDRTVHRGANPPGASSIGNGRFVVPLTKHIHQFFLRHQFQIVDCFASFFVLLLAWDAMLYPQLACEEGRLGESFGQQVGVQSIWIVRMLELQVRTLDQIHPIVCARHHARRLPSFVGGGLMDQVRSSLVHLQALARQGRLALDHAIVQAPLEVHVRRCSSVAVLDKRDQPLSQERLLGTQGIALVQLSADHGQILGRFAMQGQIVWFGCASFFVA